MDILITVTFLGFAAIVYSLWDVFSVIQQVGKTLHQDLLNLQGRQRETIERRPSDRTDGVQQLSKTLDAILHEIKEQFNVSPSVSRSQLYMKFGDRLIDSLKDIEDVLRGS